MKLTDVAVRKAKCPEDKKQIKKSDGRGLYLLIKANGGKFWRYDFSFKGKRQTLAIGIYPVHRKTPSLTDPTGVASLRSGM